MSKKLRRLIDAGEPFLVKQLQNGEPWELIVTKYRAGAQGLRHTRPHSHSSAILPTLPLLLQGICRFKVGASKPCHRITHFSRVWCVTQA